MAEETVVTPAPEVKVVDQENKTPDQQKTEQQERVYTDTEQRALDQGWKPIEDWEGDPADHRSAKEYIDRGELLGKIRSQSTEIREVKQMLTTLSEHNKKVYLAGFEDALAKLKAEKVVALREGEAEAVVDIDEKIAEHKQTIQTIKATPVPKVTNNGPSPEFSRWLETNRWYEQDEAMRYWADGMAMTYAKNTQNPSEQGCYDYLTKKVKETFPQKFQRTAAPNPDGDSRRTVNGSAKKGGDRFEEVLAQLDEQGQKVARDFVKQGLITKEKYVEDFDAIGGR